MTAKDQLQRAIDDLTEDETADVLQLLAQPRRLDGETATRLLDSIPGAWETAHAGADARAGRTTSLDDLRRANRWADGNRGQADRHAHRDT